MRHLEASRWQPATVYALFDGHQNGDFRNWIYRSTDYGQTWTSIAADLPASVVPHVIREDVASPNLLFLGTEFGLFVSGNSAQSWVPLRANMPMVPVNDLVIQPRDHALVLGTHGRGIWILDDLRPLRALLTGASSVAVTLAPIPTSVHQKRLAPRISHSGDMHFRGENPASGIAFTVLARDSGTAATVVVQRAGGGEMWRQVMTTRRGANQVTWNLRGPSLPAIPSPLHTTASGGGGGGGGGGEDEDAKRPLSGAFVRPGTYDVIVDVGGTAVARRTFDVHPDRRQDASPAAREAWHVAMDSIATLYRATSALEQRTRATGPSAKERADTIAELQMRVGALHQLLESQVGAPTADMRAQLASFARVYAREAGR